MDKLWFVLGDARTQQLHTDSCCAGAVALLHAVLPAPQAISSATFDTSSGDNVQVAGHVLIESPAAPGAKQLRGATPVRSLDDMEAGAQAPLQRSGSSGGLALPFQPMSVAFKDVSYFVPHPGVSFGFEGGVVQGGVGAVGFGS